MKIRRFWPVVVLLILTLLVFNRLAFSGLILARGDTYSYFYPYWIVRNTALMQGQLPLWSPDVFMGVPLLANPQLGTFYPPNWLLISLAPPDGIRISILMHIFWALLGMYVLAKQQLRATWPALVAAVVFGFGGYVGAHVEQINQLQGLAWLPWLFWLYQQALDRPSRYVPLLAIAFAMQFFTGHTQTVFIAGVGLGVYGLTHGPLRLSTMGRAMLILAAAGLLTLPLILPQLLPTLELTQVSNRSGGLSFNEATSFSFNPLVVGRGLLPSYDGLLFGEYVAYGGVIGLGLALLGVVLSRPRRPWTWIVIAMAGLLLSFGEFNPLYQLLLRLPGFGFFRVPARWLTLFALGMALLAGHGLAALQRERLRRWHYGLIVGVMLVLALSSLLVSRTPEDVIGPAVPTAITWAGWALGLFGLLVILRVWRTGDAASIDRANLRVRAWHAMPLLIVELFLASQVLPYNTLTLPETYHAQRFTVSQLLAYKDEANPPGRSLSISELLFDPGDKAALERRYAEYNLSDLAVRLSLVDTKLKEVLAPNQSLVWGLPSIDGFDGGLLPTRYYTEFSTLLMPEGIDPTTDGRLREGLALPDCRGACIPDQRWLNLTNTRYLITDKVYDLWHEDVYNDTQIAVMLNAAEFTTLDNPTEFTADAVDVLYVGDSAPEIQIENVTLTPADSGPLDVFTRQRWFADSPIAPDQVVVEADSDVSIHAITLVDTRTGDFIPLTLGDWQRQMSSDIKLYENQRVLPRAFMVYDAQQVNDENTDAQQVLDLLRNPDFDPAGMVVIHGVVDSASESVEFTPPLNPLPIHGEGTLHTILSQFVPPLQFVERGPGGEVKSTHAVSLQTGIGHPITTYTPTHIEIQVATSSAGYLLLTDAYYPGWQATVNDIPALIYRADIMFRAVPVPAGEHTIAFDYQPYWLPGALWAGLLAWFIMGIATLVLWRRVG